MTLTTQLKGSANSDPAGSSDSGKSVGEGQHANVSEKEKSPVTTQMVDKDGMCHKHQTWVCTCTHNYSKLVLYIS